jgi:hypothetical protein
VVRPFRLCSFAKYRLLREGKYLLRVQSSILTHVLKFDELLKFWVALCKSNMATLGYDPSIWRVETEEEEQFRITFQGIDAQEQPIVEEYLTKRWLSNVSADYLAGRATRVWEVVKIDPRTQQTTDEHKVLKDAWVEHDRISEGTRYREIAKWFDDNPEHAKLASNFLTFHGDSRLRGGDVDESTIDSIRGGLIPSDESDRVVDLKSRRNVSTSGTGTHGPTVSNDFFSKGVGAVDRLARYVKQVFSSPVVNRVHYRIIVNEVCKRIYEMKSFRFVLACLWGASGGKGYTHTFKRL